MYYIIQNTREKLDHLIIYASFTVTRLKDIAKNIDNYQYPLIVQMAIS